MTVTRWVQRFKAGQESLEDDHRSGSHGIESCEYSKNRNFKHRQSETFEVRFGRATSLSRKTILRILHDHLEMRKVAARWIPHFLTPENKKKNRVLSGHARETRKRSGDLITFLLAMILVFSQKDSETS